MTALEDQVTGLEDQVTALEDQATALMVPVETHLE